ncbi:13875_t:CDS:2 [Rhizophagus irregularis]|nr:13875_t:CDS:2 [Rhizophagus irregularis]
MPMTTNFESEFSTQPIQQSTRRKPLAKNRLSDIRRRFSSFSPRNSIIFLKPDIQKEETNFFLFVKDNNNSSQTKHKRSISENKNQMNKNYEEPTNEVILDEPSSSLIKSVIRRFTKLKKKHDEDKEYQDGKTNPFE